MKDSLGTVLASWLFAIALCASAISQRYKVDVRTYLSRSARCTGNSQRPDVSLPLVLAKQHPPIIHFLDRLFTIPPPLFRSTPYTTRIL
jgi:hypothetical protein